MKIFIFSILIFVKSFAAYFSTGTFVPYFNKEQVSESGSTKVFELNPYFGLGTNIHLSGSTYFLPELAYSYLKNSEDGVRQEIVFLNYHFSYYNSPQFIIKYGLSTYWWRIVGQGGTKRLRNGDGSTNFKLPNETRTSYVTALMAGFESFFKQDQSFRFDFYIMDSINAESRAYNYFIGLNFYL
tara:strand:- start:96948 stop:97499 length:552 start_codon:yes stop_codon:yes gene_type:complete